ncbi:2-succinyl-5-enolpyruvyl-6-hydroxy-3-cyclohexene-1-carboxylic-acid synthase [Ectothiorhodospira lacustris]|uniref:2-succinyl-5-enolpyruvyl-6-hydroxy-3- cyclohexene-1-carboxylic-acid synthase n=1 Tax=Ectothiorhodospira lacustris TaxID=2899127 RepID=UPI001EE8AE46|nr:2-succinyl-5-enolpyruvyl-6-hydroxy-3-cyclohexene-1-carboxylic-acid synthase [Ectothiorhodospira lacustris]MCG5499430.1 2-succinyl-5-enolpyruvyl-6-hydroxy-3-cyclohexene-1-carboxylic-acid synthase [Ectothiorhodospira lacustris]MCG5511265.1 2-succinyl-5-enolpyruvyl-6-hydroxy-3-cyclohexene-1-carboxylic-acid synthase [Ectothiorhodospira lacustris]MCG5522993.1 2-succinyl-5-enolpyruvyl-6-hydroxy-3-cyclohexene-1-carboxylic-acid synthase [Ectothiorhodospira lacustris]
MRAAFTHINEAWAHLLIDRLYQHGVRDICLAPGSRSAPLSLAAARYRDDHPDLGLHTHFDERGLAFLGLGLCKAGQRPVALITTSGTAVPNLHPALVEAFQTHQPLVAVTADRPEELVGCGANQAIVQPGIFQSHTRAALNLPPPDATLSGGWLAQQLDAVLARLRGPDRGPVHINVPFREPLYGTSDSIDFGPWLADVPPVEMSPPPHPGFSLHRLREPVIFVAGQLDTEEAEAVLALAETASVPILADIGSQLRLREHPCVLAHPDLLLAITHVRRRLKAMHQVVQFGGRITSKRINQWLACFQGQYWLVSPHEDGLDPEHHATQIQASIPEFCNQLRVPPQRGLGIESLQSQLSEHLELTLTYPFSEPAAARIIADMIPENMLLLPGNSLSIRLLDMVARPGRGNRCITNRGASGIDGLVATAMGLAMGHPAGATLLIGDLSLLHDLNSLALAPRCHHPLIIVVLNNDGGGIFNLLPAAEQKEHFQALFQLPHGLTFRSAAALFGLAYANPDSAAGFEKTYSDACRKGGVTLIELNFPHNQSSRIIKGLISALVEVRYET